MSTYENMTAGQRRDELDGIIAALDTGHLPRIEAVSEPGEFTLKYGIDRWVVSCGGHSVRFLSFDGATAFLRITLQLSAR